MVILLSSANCGAQSRPKCRCLSPNSYKHKICYYRRRCRTPVPVEKNLRTSTMYLKYCFHRHRVSLVTIHMPPTALSPLAASLLKLGGPVGSHSTAVRYLRPKERFVSTALSSKQRHSAVTLYAVAAPWRTTARRQHPLWNAACPERSNDRQTPSTQPKPMLNKGSCTCREADTYSTQREAAVRDCSPPQTQPKSCEPARTRR